MERTSLEGPIPEAELAAIAAESSQAERRADDAERELMEWKKIKFMQDRVGEDFNGIILSCTKYGFFVELDDLFIEGLVPLRRWQDERYYLPRYGPADCGRAERAGVQDGAAGACAAGPDRPAAAAAAVCAVACEARSD